MIFFTADLHLWHKNVITYCNRPYVDTTVMYEAIIEQWNSQVTKNDIVYILGDLTFNPRNIEPFLQRVNFKEVYLISGNHDATHIRPDTKNLDKRHQAIRRYKRSGFTDVYQEHWLTISKPRRGILGWLGLKKTYKVQLSHFPFIPKAEEVSKGYDTRYTNCRPADVGQILLHGHSHCVYRKNRKQIDCGFDGGLKLYSEHDIIDLIEDPREYIPSELTDYYKAKRNQLVLEDTHE